MLKTPLTCSLAHTRTHSVASHMLSFTHAHSQLFLWHALFHTRTHTAFPLTCSLSHTHTHSVASHMLSFTHAHSQLFLSHALFHTRTHTALPQGFLPDRPYCRHTHHRPYCTRTQHRLYCTHTWKNAWYPHTPPCQETPPHTWSLFFSLSHPTCFGIIWILCHVWCGELCEITWLANICLCVCRCECTCEYLCSSVSACVRVYVHARIYMFVLVCWCVCTYLCLNMVMNRANYVKRLHFLVCAFMFGVPNTQKKYHWLISQREGFKGYDLCVSASFVLSFSLFFSFFSVSLTHKHIIAYHRKSLLNHPYPYIYTDLYAFIYTLMHTHLAFTLKPWTDCRFIVDRWPLTVHHISL